LEKDIAESVLRKDDDIEKRTEDAILGLEMLNDSKNLSLEPSNVALNKRPVVSAPLKKRKFTKGLLI
jgi:hypothetical protein